MFTYRFDKVWILRLDKAEIHYLQLSIAFLTTSHS